MSDVLKFAVAFTHLTKTIYNQLTRLLFEGAAQETGLSLEGQSVKPVRSLKFKSTTCKEYSNSSKKKT